MGEERTRGATAVAQLETALTAAVTAARDARDSADGERGSRTAAEALVRSLQAQIAQLQVWACPGRRRGPGGGGGGGGCPRCSAVVTSHFHNIKVEVCDDNTILLFSLDRCSAGITHFEGIEGTWYPRWMSPRVW